MHNVAKSLLRYVKAYAICVAAFCALLVVVSCVPTSWIRGNVEESLETLELEGDYPEAWPTATMEPHVLDSFSTALSLNVAMHVTGRPPFGAFSGSYYLETKDMVENLVRGLDKDGQINYPRFWHGYLALLVPLLLFCNLTQIRMLFVMLISLLACIAIALLAKREGVGAALSLGVACVLTNLWAVAASTSLAFAGIISFAATIAVLLRAKPESKALGEDITGVFFFVVGALTVYVDFLHTPIVTLGLPLATYVLLHRKAIEKSRMRDVLVCMAVFAVSWGAGYALVWVTKWIISVVLLGAQAWTETLSVVSDRSSTTNPWNGQSISRLDVVKANVRQFVTGGMLRASAVLGLLWAVVTAFFHRQKGWKPAVALVLVSLLPIAWYLAMPNHSMEHSFFTFRCLSVTAYALCLMMTVFTDWDALGRRVCELKQRLVRHE